MFAKRAQAAKSAKNPNGSQSVTANLSSYNHNGESINTSDSISTGSYVANFYTTSTPSSLSYQPHHHHHHHLQQQQQHHSMQTDTNRSGQQRQQVSRRRRQQQLQISAPMLVPMMIDDELDLIDDQNGLHLRAAEDQRLQHQFEGDGAANDDDDNNNNNNSNHIGVYQALGGRHLPTYLQQQQLGDWRRYHPQQQQQQQQLDCVDSAESQPDHRHHLELARHNRWMFSSSIGRPPQQQAGHHLSHASSRLFHDSQHQQQQHLFGQELGAGQSRRVHTKRTSQLRWPSQPAKPNRTSSGDSGGPLVGSTSSGSSSSSSSSSSKDTMSQQVRHQHHSARRPTGAASNHSKSTRKAHRNGLEETRQPAAALSCCGKLAKLLLFICNLMFWCSGFALAAWGILALVDEHKYNLSQLLVFEASSSRTSLFQLLAWSFITLGCAGVLVGFCGCSAILKNNRWILGLYIFLILAIFALDLATGLLAIIFQERLVANVRLRLANKLRSDYGVQASFTAAIDYIQTKFECCGLEGHFDYDQSLWRLQRLGGFEATVARTCCHLRNTFDDQAHINPRPVNESMCQSTDVRFHQSYRYRRGCLDDLERLVRQKIWTYTIGCVAVGALVLLSLLFATCFCRSIPSKQASRKSSLEVPKQLTDARSHHR